MTFVPYSIKVCDDILFLKFAIPGPHHTYRCIHLPTLVIMTQLPGGSIDLTENAFAALLPECKMETCTAGTLRSIHEEIYSAPSCHPKHSRYWFIFSRVLDESKEAVWEISEVEVDLSIPGPIKIFGRVSQQYTVPRPTLHFHQSVDGLLLSFPSVYGFISYLPLSIRFLQVGKPDGWRVVKLGGVDKMYLCGLHVDRDAGYIITWVRGGRLGTREQSFIWWIDGSKPGAVVHSPAKDLAPGRSRRRLWSFWNSFIYQK
jgi:hypothetical protein